MTSQPSAIALERRARRRLLTPLVAGEALLVLVVVLAFVVRIPGLGSGCTPDASTRLRNDLVQLEAHSGGVDPAARVTILDRYARTVAALDVPSTYIGQERALRAALGRERASVAALRDAPGAPGAMIAASQASLARATAARALIDAIDLPVKRTSGRSSVC